MINVFSIDGLYPIKQNPFSLHGFCSIFSNIRQYGMGTRQADPGLHEEGLIMIKLFSFAASCAGKNSHTAAFSDILAQAFIKKAEAEGETVVCESLTGADFRIDYCRSCIRCFMQGVCPLDRSDDMAKLKEKMREADILFFGTPVYLWQMSGIAKSVLDRISYWSHRFELIGKPCVVFSSTSSSHGPEVSKELAFLMRFTGAVVIDAGTQTRRGIEIDPEETAGKLMGVYKDPASGVTAVQQNAFLGRVLHVRRYFKNKPEEAPVTDEMRVFRERGLDRYVLLREAIEDLCGK